MKPFFSIFISSFNRSATIDNTLKYLSLQTFKNFEVIIVDCKSSDNTREVINEFFKSEFFKNNSFEYYYYEKEYTPQTVEDWNEGILYTKGKYSISLEGDDYFLENYLEDAYTYLIENPNTGLYFPGKKYNEEKIKSDVMLQKLYSLIAVPAPSEAIFISEHQGKKYLYNVTDYNYCPEVELYISICNDGYEAYYSGIDGVVRDRTVKSRGKWKYYRDHYFILERYKNKMPSKEYEQAVKRINKIAYLGLIYDILLYKGENCIELRNQLRVRHGILFFYHYFKYSIFIMCRALFRKIFK